MCLSSETQAQAVPNSLDKYFSFEDKFYTILSSDTKKKSELLKNRYISFFILNSFDWYNVDKSLNLNEAKYGIANDFAQEFNFKISKKLYNYCSSLVDKISKILVQKGFIRYNKSLNKYYLTSEGSFELSIYKKANICCPMIYNSPYCKYFVFFLRNLHGVALSDKVLSDLSSMCKDSDFAYESFCYFRNRLIERNVLIKDVDNYYLEDEVYYHLMLLLAVRGYDVL